jgi:hypothetical protein
MVHSTWRAPPIVTPASELATAMPEVVVAVHATRPRWSELGTRSRRVRMKLPYSSGMA